MRIYIAHAGSFDFEQKLYGPLRNSPLWNEHEFVLPHADRSDVNSKEIIATCDLVIAETSHPSTGEGIELGWADAAGIPVVCIHESGSKPSGALRHVTSSIHEYNGSAEMLNIIERHAREKGGKS